MRERANSARHRKAGTALSALETRVPRFHPPVHCHSQGPRSLPSFVIPEGVGGIGGLPLTLGWRRLDTRTSIREKPPGKSANPARSRNTGGWRYARKNGRIAAQKRRHNPVRTGRALPAK